MNLVSENYNPDQSVGPNAEEISARAQQFWESAGKPSGADLEFWLAAEIVTAREHSEFMQAARAHRQHRAARRLSA